MSVAKDRAAGREQIPQSVRFRVFQRDNFTCRYCGVVSGDGVTLHIDHAKSVKDGGGADEKNLVTACSDCNYGKGAQSIQKPPSLKTKVTPQPDDLGLVGLWGHSFVADGQLRGKKQIQWQFEIIRKISDVLYVCQLFSWLSGDATSCEILSAKVLTEECKLYATNAQMIDSYEKETERRKADIRRAVTSGELKDEFSGFETAA